MDRAEEDLGRWARFGATASLPNVRLLLDASARHMDRLPMDEPSKLPARFLLRRLLGNLAEIGRGEPIEVIQGFEGGRLKLIVRCPALAFAKRFGAYVDPTPAKQALEREMANVLNLRWFATVQTTREGAALLFEGHGLGTFG